MTYKSLVNEYQTNQDAISLETNSIVEFHGSKQISGCVRITKVTQGDGHGGRSGMVVYGGGGIVFGAKRSNHWMQWKLRIVICTQEML